MARLLPILLALLVATTTVAAPSGVPAQVALINEMIEQGWRDFEVRPADEVDDATWCRRVFLDIIGRIPSNDELQEFLDDGEKGRGKRAILGRSTFA